MEEKNYKEVTNQAFKSKDNEISNLYNLASAYIEFINQEDIYTYGVQSMAEYYLSVIKSPSSELQKYIDSLLIQIENKKADNASELGVVIGMTKEQVLKSSWEKPQKVNTTVTAFGTREQWVYPGYQYLYFQDDILVTIQN